MNRRPLLFIIVILLALAAPAGGQSFRIPFQQAQLDNGLRIVMSVDRSAPVVAVAVYYDVGSRNEAKGRSGFAHLFEHMMFQGSENVGKTEHFKYVENNGGYFNGSTYVDYTNYYQILPSNQLELALWLEADRMRSLKITRENLDNQREAVKEEKRLRIDNQAYWPSLTRLDEMLYHKWENAHPPIGSMADLDAASVEDVQKFFDTYYAPNNAVLAIAGDFDPAEAERLARKYFGTIPRRPPPPAVDVSEPFESVRASDTADDPRAEMPALTISWKIPPRRAADFYAVALLKAILLDGESARLYQKLVKDEAVALEIQGFLEARRGPGSVSLFAIHKAEVSGDAVQSLVEAELARITAEGVSDEELTKAKNQYRLSRFIGGDDRSEYESLQTALGRAMLLAEYTLFDGDPDLINREIDHYLADTASDIREAARKYFGKANRAVLFIRPAPAAAPARQ